MSNWHPHLTEPEFVDLLDGVLKPSRRQHVDECDACAAQAARLVASAHDAQLADVPQPPPFFWTQFSARVAEAVSREAIGLARPRLARLSAPWVAAVACAAVVVLAVVVLLHRADDSLSDRAVAAVQDAGADGTATVPDEAIDLESDEAWALVRTLAEDMDDDQMNDEGISAGAGAAEHLTLQLTDAERTELARLLQEQLRLGRASESVS